MTTGAASFDCLFSTRDTPFVLTLTVRGETRGFFRFDVLNGYRIRNYLGDMYGDLIAVLRSDGASAEGLKPKDFLAQLNQAIPTEASVRANPNPSEIVRLRPDIIEEREKPFFNAWIYWKEDNRRRPSEENQPKTLLLLGPKAARHSREQNASSRWSATDTGGVWKAQANG